MKTFVATTIAVAGLAYAAVVPSKTLAPNALPYYASRDFTPKWSPVGHQIAPFQLVDQTNSVITEKDLDGKIHVASFLFTECPSICPTLIERLKPVQNAIRGHEDTLMVSYSVTPVTDTPPVLARFGTRRGVDPRSWKLVTGPLDGIRTLLHDSYFADDTRALKDGEQSRLLHTEKVLLIDRTRHLRGIYNGTNAFEMERLIDDIATLRAES